MSAISTDPYSLLRFIEAQQFDYAKALAEIARGRKRSHWMWYIFPQNVGLGYSEMSKHYAIRSASEAKAYLEHPLLSVRIKEISGALLKLETSSPEEVFGPIDALKLQSSMTLFAAISAQESVFRQVIDKYFAGQPSHRTLEWIEQNP